MLTVARNADGDKCCSLRQAVVLAVHVLISCGWCLHGATVCATCGGTDSWLTQTSTTVHTTTILTLSEQQVLSAVVRGFSSQLFVQLVEITVLVYALVVFIGTFSC